MTETLQDKVSRLEADNARLAAELDESRGRERATPNTRPVDKQPTFGMSEGERSEAEMIGFSMSPFDGKIRDADGNELKRDDKGRVLDRAGKPIDPAARRAAAQTERRDTAGADRAARATPVKATVAGKP